MATFVVCSKCGRVQETAVIDQIPKDWQRSIADLYCSHCADTSVLDVGAASDVIEEEVIYPSGDEDLDEGLCEVCKGPCQGH